MNDYNSTNNAAMEWDSVIIAEKPEYILLTPGEYSFEVTGFERGRFMPGPTSRLTECPKADITCRIETDKGDVTIKHTLFLHTRMEASLSAFFVSIGHKKEGEPLRMNWATVIGASGTCAVGNRPSKDGNALWNEIKKFLPPAKNSNVPAQSGGFMPGKF